LIYHFVFGVLLDLFFNFKIIISLRFIVFTPVWIGNIIVSYLQVRLIMQLGVCIGKVMSYSNNSSRIMEQEDSLSITGNEYHFVSRVTIAVVLSLPISIFVATSEILYCNHLQKGSPSYWFCFTPLVIIEVFALVQYLLVKNPWRDGAIKFLLLLSTIGLLHQASTMHDEQVEQAATPLIPFEMSWPLAVLPLELLNLICIYSFANVFYYHSKGKYVLTLNQKIVGSSNIVGFSLLSLGELIVAFIMQDEAHLHHKNVEKKYNNSQFKSSLFLPMMMLFVGCLLISIALCLLLEIHGSWLILSRGYGNPLPLSLTEKGWGPSIDEELTFDIAFGLLEKTSSSAASSYQLHHSIYGDYGGLSTGNILSSDDDRLGGGHTSGGGHGPGGYSSGGGGGGRKRGGGGGGGGGIYSDHYDSSCDNSAFNEIYGGNTTGPESGIESS
jgi:uncharacterized membrane protein YgcG